MLTIKLTDISVLPNRQRKEVDQKYLDELSESIRIYGLLNPIIVDENNVLIAGYCRLKAHEILGRTEILVRKFDELNQWEKECVELEENVRRKNLTFQEQCEAELRLFEHYQSTKPVKSTFYAHTDTARKGFSIQDMAKLLGFSYGKTNQRLNLAKSMRTDPSLAVFKTESQARHALEKRQSTAARIVLAKLAEATQPKEDKIQVSYPTYSKGSITLYNTKCSNVIPSLPDESIGCLITDPPWNVAFDETFGSDPTKAFPDTVEMLKLLYPKLQPGSICLMYCATRHLIKGDIFRLVKDCGYAIYNTIHIWYKPQVASSSVPYRELKNDYEPALLFSKGLARDFNVPMYSVIQTRLEETRVHEAQKPVSVLQQLIENFSVQGEIIIDPFMGSGASMVAAKKAQRKGIGIEMDNGHYSGAVLNVDETL